MKIILTLVVISVLFCFSENINIGYIIHNDNFYKSMVSLTSLLENKLKETEIDIYILTDNLLNQNYFKHLTFPDFNYTNVTIYINKIKSIPLNNELSQIFNRNEILYSLLFINLGVKNKIIILNSDTLILKDLSDLYKIDNNKYYFMGVANDNLTISTNVLLVNLDKIKNEKNLSQTELNKIQICQCIYYNCFNIQENYHLKIDRNDLYLNLINYKIRNNSIEIGKNINKLQIKFNMGALLEKEILKYINLLPYTSEEIKEALNNSYIISFIKEKPFENGNNVIYKEEWHKYANKTKIYNEIIKHYNLIYNINNLSEIVIGFSLNEGYTLPTIVAITSVIDSSKETTKFIIYCVVDKAFGSLYENKILSLKKLYPNKGEIIFIRIGEIPLIGCSTYPIQNCYRLLYGDIIPKKHDRIFYLEGDMMYMEDITEIYNLPMDNIVYRGFNKNPLGGYRYENYVVVPLLMNLKLLRELNLSEKYTKILNNRQHIKYADEMLINELNAGRTEPLPPRFCYFVSMMNMRSFLKRNIMMKHPYNVKEFEWAIHHPAMIHYNRFKPWKTKNTSYEEKWWGFATKSGYKDEIKEYYNITNNY